MYFFIQKERLSKFYVLYAIKIIVLEILLCWLSDLAIDKVTLHKRVKHSGSMVINLNRRISQTY